MLSTLVVVLLVLQFLTTSFSFIIRRRDHDLGRRHLLFSSPEQQPPPEVRTVFVDSPVSFLGVTMALYAFLDLTGKLKIPPGAEGSPPGGLPVHSVTDLEALQQSKDAILHLSVGPNSGQLPPQTYKSMSYIGIYLASEPPSGSGVQVTPEAAQGSSKVLLEQLEFLTSSPGGTSSESPKAFVTLDVALHAAILQANCLPKPKSQWTSPIPSVTPHQDAYYVMQPNGDTLLIDYMFDQANVAGMDPLFCETRETLVETSPTKPSLRRSIVQSAAYTALRGNGMDPLGSAAIAAGVTTILGDADFSTTQLLWSDVQRAVQLAQHIRQSGIKKDLAGTMRQKYLGLGYT